MSDSVLKCSNVFFDYPRRKVLNDVSLDLKQNSIGVLVGPSGCGKTTMLRLIAGLEKPKLGEIIVNSKNNKQKPTIGFVFQDYALFPHMTVKQNIEFPISSLSKTERETISFDLMKMFGLTNETDKYPHQISGGQQQRVAVARSLSMTPDLLLMDEPFSNLDFSLRQNLIIELKDIFKKLAITCLFVTHDLTEAFSFADQIGVIHNGDLLQWGFTNELIALPNNKLVIEILQTGNLIPCEQHNNQLITSIIELSSSQIKQPLLTEAKNGYLFLPHGKISIVEQSAMMGKIERITNSGKMLNLSVQIGSEIQINLFNTIDLDLQVGQIVHLKIDWSHAVFVL